MQRAVAPPATLFGLAAVWRADAHPTEVGSARVGGYLIRALRWELRDVVIDSLDLGDDGHLIVYAVEGADGAVRVLTQQDSTFYQEEGSPSLTYLRGKLRQGDGLATPKWHKSDRAWPVEGETAYEFADQGYIGTNVVYLFRHPHLGRVAIFSDEVDRQDAEEHYAEEERRR
jgi:hypothetical protein